MLSTKSLFLTLLVINLGIFISYIIYFYKHNKDPTSKFIIQYKQADKNPTLVNKCDSAVNELCFNTGLTNQDLLNKISTGPNINKLNISIGILMIIIILLFGYLSNYEKISEGLADSGYSFFESFEEKINIFRFLIILIPGSVMILSWFFRDKIIKSMNNTNNLLRKFQDQTTIDGTNKILELIFKSANIYTNITLAILIFKTLMIFILIINPFF